MKVFDWLSCCWTIRLRAFANQRDDLHTLRCDLCELILLFCGRTTYICIFKLTSMRRGDKVKFIFHGVIRVSPASNVDHIFLESFRLRIHTNPGFCNLLLLINKKAVKCFLIATVRSWNNIGKF